MLYVLPYGQMSLWGSLLNAPNAFLEIYLNFKFDECLGSIDTTIFANNALSASTSLPCPASPSSPASRTRCSGDINKPKIRSEKRIGPHNLDILSILIGSLLGDGHMDKSVNGSRFCFYQAKVNGEYLL